jgi:hypothetical protein
MSLQENGFAYEWELFICELAKKVVQKENGSFERKRVVVDQFVHRVLDEFLVKKKKVGKKRIQNSVGILLIIQRFWNVRFYVGGY